MTLSVVADIVVATVIHLLGVVGAVHAILTKREPRSAFIWLLICLFVPILGVILYLVFGINRIHIVRQKWHAYRLKSAQTGGPSPDAGVADVIKTGNRLIDMPLVAGNRLIPLFDGTEAYPVMLDAIRQAKTSIYLSSYIFAGSGIGKEFIDALAFAHHKGIDVRVLVDGVGSAYTWPSAQRLLKRRKVPTALFSPPFRSWYYALHLNLRNHAKILVVDGVLGFTGGMNLHQKNMASLHGIKIHDLHFKVEGPIVAELQDAFLQSWYFAVKTPPKPVALDEEKLAAIGGSAFCRGIVTGPYQEYPIFALMLCAAIHSAKKNIRIMTPYFLPTPPLIWALVNATLRGVAVEIILPKANNLRLVKGASEALFPSLINFGIHLYYDLRAFSHNKLFIVDEETVFLGSSNLDSRSLILNFEFDLEVYDRTFAGTMAAYFDNIKSHAQKINTTWLHSQNFLVKLRNSIYTLFTPYL